MNKQKEKNKLFTFNITKSNCVEIVSCSFIYIDYLKTILFLSKNFTQTFQIYI